MFFGRAASAVRPFSFYGGFTEMTACTFFGHRDCPDEIRPQIYKAITDLIVNKGVDVFYVGNHGNFDSLVHSCLKELKQEHPHIKYSVVLAYLPKNKTAAELADCIVPQGIETVHWRKAIPFRNNWMIFRSQFVICYIRRPRGGAFAFTEKAKNQGKIIISL